MESTDEPRRQTNPRQCPGLGPFPDRSPGRRAVRLGGRHVRPPGWGAGHRDAQPGSRRPKLNRDFSSRPTANMKEIPMPYINVTVAAKPDPKLSARIAGEVSRLTKEHLRKDPTVTAI